MISYELAMSLSFVGVLILAGTTSLDGIVAAQSRWWFVVPQIVGFIIYIITAVAETNRTPFDLVEAETELVAGFHTEYSGLRFGLFFIAEYVNMLTVSCIATLLFFGGWNAPFGLTMVPGIVWFLLKVGAFMFFYMWLRATLPRLRYDRLMAFGWKVLLPVATLNLVVTAIVVALQGIIECAKICSTSARSSKGFAITFQFMFRKRPTIEYPTIKKQHAPRFHGLHELRRYDDGKERCIGCELCSSACPANAITVIGAENAPDDRTSPGERYAARYEIDELRCIFCGMCEEACPTDAIVLTPRFEMADYPPRLVHLLERPSARAAGSRRRRRARRAPGRHSRRSRTRRRDQIDDRHRGGLLGDATAARFSRRSAKGWPDDRAFGCSAPSSSCSAVWTITAKKPVYSVVGLLANFAALAALYLTLYAEFLAVMQIIVYSGAILVLFVFVIALLSSGVAPFAQGPNRLPKISVPAIVLVLVATRLSGVRALAHRCSAARRSRLRRSNLGPVGNAGRLRQRCRFRQGAVHRASAAV